MALANTKKNDSKTELMGKDNGQAGEGATGPGSAEWLAERPGIQNAIEKGHAPLIDIPLDHGIALLSDNDVEISRLATDTDILEQNPQLLEQLKTVDADSDGLVDLLVADSFNFIVDMFATNDLVLDPDAVAQFDPATFDVADIESAVLHKSDGTDYELAWFAVDGFPFLGLIADDGAFADPADVNGNNDTTAGADQIVVTLVGGQTGVFQMVDLTEVFG